MNKQTQLCNTRVNLLNQLPAHFVGAGLVVLAAAGLAGLLIPVVGSCDIASPVIINACRIEPWATWLPIVIPLGLAAGVVMMLLGLVGAIARSRQQ